MRQADRTRRRRAVWHSFGAGLLAIAVPGCQGQRSPTGGEPETVERVYELHCLGCHGKRGEGAYGSNIQGLKRPIADIAKVIADGAGKMPSFRGHLTDAQMRALAEYVKTFK
jgi:mono/diheme cytochrome c family protein